MEKNDDINRMANWYRCPCGLYVDLTQDQFEKGDAHCPACGTSIDRGQMEEWNADTQMVNLQEMARMAQEGVGVASSGEWDTRELTANPRKKSRSPSK